MIDIIIYDVIEGKRTMTILSEEDKVYEVRPGFLTVRERECKLGALMRQLDKILSWIK